MENIDCYPTSTFSIFSSPFERTAAKLGVFLKWNGRYLELTFSCMQRIAESELIINSRGAIYHLDVRPEELAENIITVGDPDRVGEVSKYFDKVEVRRQHREFVTHTGSLGKKRFSVISTGIGPDNIDIVLNELDALANIDLDSRTIRPRLSVLKIIRIGTSGALQNDIPVDSYLASTHGLGIDNLLNFYRGAHNDADNQLLHSF